MAVTHQLLVILWTLHGHATTDATAKASANSYLPAEGNYAFPTASQHELTAFTSDNNSSFGPSEITHRHESTAEGHVETTSVDTTVSSVVSETSRRRVTTTTATITTTASASDVRKTAVDKGDKSSVDSDKARVATTATDVENMAVNKVDNSSVDSDKAPVAIEPAGKTVYSGTVAAREVVPEHKIADKSTKDTVSYVARESIPGEAAGVDSQRVGVRTIRAVNSSLDGTATAASPTSMWRRVTHPAVLTM